LKKSEGGFAFLWVNECNQTPLLFAFYFFFFFFFAKFFTS